MKSARPSSLEKSLARLVGAERVFSTPEKRSEHAGDKWSATAEPEVVVHAQSAAHVSKVLKFATKHAVPVTTRGAGVGYVGGCVPVKGGIALSVAGMEEILSISTADGVAIVEPGVITGHLQREVKKLGWFYPPDPASLNECSIGGNIATNAGGPRCLKYGVTKNYVLGLQVVTTNGQILETGGQTHKNKTGFDLAALMVGSEGMLGVVTRAQLRIIPHPPMRAMVSAGFPHLAASAAAVQAIFSSGFLPSALEIADDFTLRSARSYLGASAVPAGGSHLMVEIDGQTASVRREIKTLQSLLSDAGALDPTIALGDSACEVLWQLRREFSYSLRATGLTKLNEDIVVPRSKLVELVEFARMLERKHGFPVACFGHAGDGNIHVNIMAANYKDVGVKLKVTAALDELFEQVIEWGGSITGEHGVGLAKKRWWRKAVSREVHEAHLAIKRALDPAGILNPGKFLG